MKTMEESLLEKIAERQLEIDALKVENDELKQVVADLASLQLGV